MSSSFRNCTHLLRLLVVGLVSLVSPGQLWSQAFPQSQPLPQSQPFPQSQGPGPVGEKGRKTQSIEDMFENVARAKAERSQRESPAGAANEQFNRGMLSPVRPSDGSSFPAHSGYSRQVIPPNTLRSNSSEPLSTRPLGLRQSVTLRSFDFQDALRRMDRQCATLALLLRDETQRNPALKNVIPTANRLSSDVRVMLQNMAATSVTGDLVQAYSRVDQDWRQLEFQLQGMGGLSGDALEAMHECGRLITRMSRQLGLLPQFDRGQLHNLLLAVGTKLGTLIDDLRLADIDDRLRHSLVGALRLMRQDAYNLVDRVGDLERRDLVLELEKLNGAWQRVAPELDEIVDVHVQRRVQDIAKTIRQAHGLLWILLPPHTGVLPASRTRLVEHCRLLVDELSEHLARADQLTGIEQIRLAAQRVLQGSESLNIQLSQGAPVGVWKPLLIGVQRGWSELRAQLVSRRLVKQQMISAIDIELQRLEAGLGVENQGSDTIDQQQLLRLGAAIESTAGYVDADLQRYGSLMQPLAFRDTTLSASSAFLQSAKMFHRLIDQQADAGTVRQAATAMQDSWKRLLPGLSQIQSHGVSAIRARNLLQDHRELVEYMSEVSGFLLP